MSPTPNGTEAVMDATLRHTQLILEHYMSILVHKRSGVGGLCDRSGMSKSLHKPPHATSQVMRRSGDSVLECELP